MSDGQTETPVTPVSDFQAQLVASGAQATQVDANAILAQMQAMQAQYEANAARMEAELKSLRTQQGLAPDAITGAKDDLLAHLTARAAQYPNDDFRDIIARVKALPEGPGVTVAHTALVHDLVSEAVDTRPAHELGYVKHLSKILHRLVLDRTVSAATA